MPFCLRATPFVFITTAISWITASTTFWIGFLFAAFAIFSQELTCLATSLLWIDWITSAWSHRTFCRGVICHPCARIEAFCGGAFDSALRPTTLPSNKTWTTQTGRDCDFLELYILCYLLFSIRHRTFCRGVFFLTRFFAFCGGAFHDLASWSCSFDFALSETDRVWIQSDIFFIRLVFLQLAFNFNSHRTFCRGVFPTIPTRILAFCGGAFNWWLAQFSTTCEWDHLARPNSRYLPLQTTHRTFCRGVISHLWTRILAFCGGAPVHQLGQVGQRGFSNLIINYLGVGTNTEIWFCTCWHLPLCVFQNLYNICSHNTFWGFGPFDNGGLINCSIPGSNHTLRAAYPVPSPDTPEVWGILDLSVLPCSYLSPFTA